MFQEVASQGPMDHTQWTLRVPYNKSGFSQCSTSNCIHISIISRQGGITTPFDLPGRASAAAPPEVRYHGIAATSHSIPVQRFNRPLLSYVHHNRWPTMPLAARKQQSMKPKGLFGWWSVREGWLRKCHDTTPEPTAPELTQWVNFRCVRLITSESGTNDAVVSYWCMCIFTE